MNIIILGAGQVGSTVATELAKEESNEITVIDTNQQILSELQDRLDLRTICGNGSYPGLLEDAGADDADMIIALTNSDEINMIACQIASSLFHTPTKIARIRSPEYLRRPGLFAEDSIPVDVMISPESLVTEYIECGAIAKRILGLPAYLARTCMPLCRYSSKLRAQAVSKSMTVMPMHARIPVRSTTSADRSRKKYMSLKQVVPPRNISAMANSVPSRTNSASAQRFSAGQMCSFNQVSRRRSSAYPRSSVIGAWVCILIMPGIRA